jgi:hypothetical protein
MTGERQSLLARLWSYVCLVPQDLSPAYALQADGLPHGEGLWVEFLSDLVERRLGEGDVQGRYLHLFPEPGAAPAAMTALQEAWHGPRMALLRGQMERDIRALRALGERGALVPAGAPAGRGDEGAPGEE